MLTEITLFALAGVYLAGMLGTSYLLIEREGSYSELRFWSSVLWPIMGPILIAVRVGSSLGEKTKARKTRKALANLTRPVDILATMVVNKTMKNPEKWRSNYPTYTWSYRGCEVVVDRDHSLVRFKYNNENFYVGSLSPSVAGPLKEVCKKSFELKEKKEAAQKIHDIDMRALDAIEKITGVNKNVK